MPNKSNNNNRREINYLHENERLPVIFKCYDSCVHSIAEISPRCRSISGEVSPWTVSQGANGPSLAHPCANLQILEDMLPIFTSLSYPNRACGSVCLLSNQVP